MRIFRINYNEVENLLPDGNILGNQGEHNATVLTVTPPQEMTEDENITSYRIAFELSNCRAVHSESIAKADVISLSLFSQITSSETTAVQLEGYDTDGKLVVKSSKVTKLRFNPSVCGVETNPNASPNGMVAEVTANTSFRNNFSEDENGNLNYKGDPICLERPYTTLTISAGDVYVLETGTNAFGIYTYNFGIDFDTELKSIRIKRAGGELVDIRGMAQVDDIPYILNMYKTYLSPTNGGLALATVCFINNSQGEVFKNIILKEIESQTIEGIEVDYYTD